MLITFLILIRVVSNPLSNLFQKRLINAEGNPLFIISVTYLLLSVAALPLMVSIISAGLPVQFFFYMSICALFAVSSNTLLVKALGYSDLSLIGPVNSYKPIVGMIFAIFLLSEIPSVTGLTGVLLILFGSYFITKNTGSRGTGAWQNFFLNKGVQLRFAALILSGTEAVFLKKALIYSSPILAMGFWCVFGFIVSGFFSLLIYKNKIATELKISWNNKTMYFLLFLTTALMQFCTLLIFKGMQVSYALALFQTSALISVFLGYKYFNERNIKKRFFGSLVMIIGSALIIIYGK